MKYSINSSGNIVAERDIYSLGGFIPKGSVGAKVANEDQISQDGECWVAGGDISTRPDVRVKDNAYIGDFAGATGMHTDGVTEFSGDTLIPGKIIVRNPIADPVNNFFCKDSFIGISLDVLCGPVATTTAFPFVQGRLDHTKPSGTPTAGMAVVDANSCFSNSVIRCGKDTQIYVPANMTARVLWVYNNVSNATAYSGESELLQPGLKKVSHPIYKVGLVVFSSTSAMTPANLLATGAKILGHINSSANVDIRPESASGSYVMVNSSFIAETDNFGLNTTQLRFLAGSMYDTTMYTKTDRQEYKLYGTFRNVERLEYTKYLGDSHRTAATRDTYISAYDCPLLRVDNITYGDSLAAKGDLTLRRCIVPKAYFTHDVVNGNTYEDIDFSYANEFIGSVASGRYLYSSHREGLYAYGSNDELLGLISHPGNLNGTARLTEAHDVIPLDGNIMELGYYDETKIGSPYDSIKVTYPTRVRMGYPLPTRGAAMPSGLSGWKIPAVYYFDENRNLVSAIPNPTSLESVHPYYALLFSLVSEEGTSVKDFVSLGLSLRHSNYGKIPEITGSAYVGAGCTVRGDVQLHGDPYVNRLLDVNLWERGSNNPEIDKRWDETFILPGQFNRFRLKELIPVEPGGTVSRAVGGKIHIWYFDENGTYRGVNSGWVTSVVIPNNVYYIGATIDITSGGLVTEDDIPLANVKYLRAFKKRRYITNELDRTSPEDILIGPDYWEQGTAGGGQADAGKTYEELKATSGTTIRLKRPINVSPLSSISSASGFSRYIRVLDAVTKFHLGESLASAKMALLAAIIQKDPSAAITPSEIPNSRLVLEFVPQPRIIVPYGSSTLSISGPKIRMYDNVVLSRNLNQEGEIVLQGGAVMGYDFNAGSCMCSNGHSDAIIKLP